MIAKEPEMEEITNSDPGDRVQQTDRDMSDTAYLIQGLSLQETLKPHSLPIIDTSQKPFVIIKESFQIVLDKVGDRQFVLICINGPLRSGKSYALNHFIKYFESKKSRSEISSWINSNPDSQFSVRSGKERETLGMHLWSEPYFVETENGEELAILLMDTQGLFDEHTTALQNAFIMSISTLCSSIMIFNVMRLITEDILKQLQHYSSYAAAFMTHETDELNSDGQGTSQSQSFQDLVFLMRDFELMDYEYGAHSNSETPPESLKNYFKDTFLTVNCEDIPNENKLVRRCILNNFNKVSIFILPDPGKKFRRQPDECTVPPDEDFKGGMTEFVETLLKKENLVRKKVGGCAVTGKQFFQFVNCWAELCQEATDSFPDVRTIAETTALTQYTIAESISFAVYKDQMDEYLLENPNGVSDLNLNVAHKVAIKFAREMFEKQKGGQNSELRDEFEALLDEHISAYHSNIKVLNKKRTENAEVARKIQGLEATFLGKMQKLDDTLDRLMEDDGSETRANTGRLQDERRFEIFQTRFAGNNPELLSLLAELKELQEADRKLNEEKEHIEQNMYAPSKPNSDRFCVIS